MLLTKAGKIDTLLLINRLRLTDVFTDILKASAPARAVNVASYWAGGLDLTDLEFKRRNYDNDKAYRQSKQANRMLSAAFAEKLKPHQIAVKACHPATSIRC
jgi:NAD(P)-dependent dehydrogenase (short-subunit alcohol dehydrogenase family)